MVKRRSEKQVYNTSNLKVFFIKKTLSEKGELSKEMIKFTFVLTSILTKS